MPRSFGYCIHRSWTSTTWLGNSESKNELGLDGSNGDLNLVGASVYAARVGLVL